LAKQARDRCASAKSVADVLKHHLADLQRSGTSAALRPTPAPRALRVPRRRTAAVLSLLVATLAIAAALRGIPGQPVRAFAAARGDEPAQARPTPSDTRGSSPAQASADPPWNNPIVGSGHVSSKSWELADFSGVTIGSTFRAQIRKGDRFQVTTSCDDNVTQF